jgi:hypothetical protein
MVRKLTLKIQVWPTAQGRSLCQPVARDNVVCGIVYSFAGVHTELSCLAERMGFLGHSYGIPTGHYIYHTHCVKKYFISLGQIFLRTCNFKAPGMFLISKGTFCPYSKLFFQNLGPVLVWFFGFFKVLVSDIFTKFVSPSEYA